MSQGHATACRNFKKRAAVMCIQLASGLLALACTVMLPLVSGSALAQTGSATGLRIPRYVSLKSDRERTS